ncbi:PIG-L deacetylase family protein [Dankookia sp. GCM10030260]|uniref:PIG-L deacetylase family protein n=1 Tax=Dankookia sp. GCM10030260 TaxID=3273390 RepID=UPI003623F837
MSLAGAWLRAAERDLPLVDGLDAQLGPGGVLVVAPHPDDESLGCGGLLAACAAAGRPARVVVVSDGAGSHPNSRAWPRARLVAQRQAEARAAVGELGLDPARDIAFLGLPDTAVPMAGADFDAAVAALRRAAGPAPGTVLAAWRHDPHRDHTASFAIVAAAMRGWPAGTRLFAYPVWGLAFAHPIPGFPLPPEPDLAVPARGFRLDVARHLPAKRRAVAAHESQVSGLIDDDPGGFRLPEAALALAFRPFELFLEEAA